MSGGRRAGRSSRKIQTVSLKHEMELIPLPTATSKVWKHFGMYSADGNSIAPEHSSRVFCTIPGCSSPELVYCGNTTNLYSHLERRHPEVELPEKRQPVAGKISKFERKRRTDRGEATIRKLQQQTRRGDTTVLPSSSHCHPLMSEQSSAEPSHITNALADFVMGESRYINLVDSAGFAKFMASLCPNYRLPSSRDMLEGILTERYNQCKAVVVEIIQRTPSVALSVESWITAGGESYLSLYAHLVDENWRCQRHLLDNLLLLSAAEFTALPEFRRLFEGWEILRLGDGPLLAAVTTDSSLTTVSAAVRYHLPTTQHVPSLHEALVAGIQEGLNGELVGDLLAKTWQMLEELAGEDGLNELQSRLDGKWKSTHAVLKEMLELHPEETEEWRDLHSLVQTLDRLSEWSEVLCKSRHLEASVIVPFRYQMQESFLGESPALEQFKRNVNLKVEDVYTQSDHFLEKCTFLDPRFKSLALSEAVERQVKEELSMQQQEEEERISSRGTLTRLFASLPRRATGGGLEQELLLYEECETPGYDTDPCQWWRERCGAMPKLASLARKYLAIPCTVYVDSELNANRTQLPPYAIDILTFLHSNCALTGFK